MWPMQRVCCSCDLWTKNQLSGGVNPTAWHTHTHGCCCHCLHHNWGLHIQDLASYLHRVLHWRLYCLPVTVEHFRSLQDCQTTRTWEQNHGLWQWNTSGPCRTVRPPEAESRTMACWPSCEGEPPMYSSLHLSYWRSCLNEWWRRTEWFTNTVWLD